MINLFAKQVEKLQDRTPANRSFSQSVDLTTTPLPQQSEGDHRVETGGSEVEEMPHEDRVKKIREVLGQVWSLSCNFLCSFSNIATSSFAWLEEQDYYFAEKICIFFCPLGIINSKFFWGFLTDFTPKVTDLPVLFA